MTSIAPVPPQGDGTAREAVGMDDPRPDFSLVLGGPLFQLWRRTRLAGETLELLNRRIIMLTLLAWLPLLVLSVLEGHALGGRVKLNFLHDIEMHVRLLLAVPLLVLAELIVHRRLRVIVGQFLERKLIPADSRATFDAAVVCAQRLRNSVFAEVFMIVFVYAVGVLMIWRTQVALGVTSWYGFEENGILHPSLAGWWLGCVSLPIFQFLLLRWYYRLLIWAHFLWKISRIRLSLLPTHPDRCGGLSFLSGTADAFAPLLIAQGVVLSGLMASRIMYAGAKLPDFKVDLIGLVAVMVFAILGPLLLFGPQLASAKRAGMREYGILAQRYASDFDQKWVRGGKRGSTLRQLRPAIVGRPGHQLFGGQGSEARSFFDADRCADGGDHAAAGGSLAFDGIAVGGTAGSSGEDCLLACSAEINAALRSGRKEQAG